MLTAAEDIRKRIAELQAQLEDAKRQDAKRQDAKRAAETRAVAMKEIEQTALAQIKAASTSPFESSKRPCPSPEPEVEFVEDEEVEWEKALEKALKKPKINGEWRNASHPCDRCTKNMTRCVFPEVGLTRRLRCRKCTADKASCNGGAIVPGPLKAWASKFGTQPPNSSKAVATSRTRLARALVEPADAGQDGLRELSPLEQRMALRPAIMIRALQVDVAHIRSELARFAQTQAELKDVLNAIEARSFVLHMPRDDSDSQP